MTAKVTLSPLTPDLTDALRDVRVTEDQIKFSGQPYEVIDHPEPGLDIHVIQLSLIKICKGAASRPPVVGNCAITCRVTTR